jgi:valyl-tRNA synthetase
MLHPFMPFITEEIWQKLPRPQGPAGESIMLQPWPHMQSQMISKKHEDQMHAIIELVTAIRNIRAVWNIDPRTEVTVIINVHEAADGKLVNANIDVIKRMARISGLTAGKVPKPSSAAVSVVGTMEVYVPLAGLIDFQKEKSRLEKDMAKMETEMHGLTGRLKDKNFLSKAPKEVVEQQQVRKAELATQIQKLKDNMKEIDA